MAEMEREKSSLNEETATMDVSGDQQDDIRAVNDNPELQSKSSLELSPASLPNEGLEAKVQPTTDTVTVTTVADSSMSCSSKTDNDCETESKIETQAPDPVAPVQFKMPSKGPRKPSASVKAALSDAPDSSKKDIKEASNEKSDKSTKEAKPNLMIPAEKLQLQAPLPVPYKEPEWGGLCGQNYSFEIVKSGAVVDTYDLTSKSFHVVGRLPTCDHCMEHPSLSRYHAVLQYCAVANDRHPKGWYLYDIDSTHGTTVNKYQVKGRVFTPLKVGYIVKFAGSTRLYILQGPSEDQDEESTKSVAELIAQRDAAKEGKEGEGKPEEPKEGESGCSWGLDDDAPPDMEINPFSLNETKCEKLYLDDPKKALKGFFEREGYDLPEYEFVDSSCGKHTCRVELPVDLLSGTTGEPLYGEASLQGKKKDVVIACALDACRILDKHDLLRRSKHESRAKKRKNWKQDDFYGSDDDEFLDRTGDIERKRKMRIKMFGNKKETAATYESLLPQLEDVEKEIAELELKLEKAKSDTESLEAQGLDALDAYMTAIKAGTMDTKTRMSIKRSLVDLRREQQRLTAMVKVARPAHLPSLEKLPAQPDKPKLASKQMFGKMKGKNKTTFSGQTLVTHEKDLAKWKETEMKIEEDSDEEEEEEVGSVKEEVGSVKKEVGSVKEKVGSVKKEVGSVKEVDSVKKEVESVKREVGSVKKEVESVKKEVGSVKKVVGSVKMIPNEDKPAEEKKNDITEVDANKKSLPKKVEDEVDSENVKSAAQKKKKRRSTGPKMVAEEEDAEETPAEKKAKKNILTSKDYCDDDPDYATWVPPQDQTGDGKTHLNARYGY